MRTLYLYNQSLERNEGRKEDLTSTPSLKPKPYRDPQSSSIHSGDVAEVISGYLTAHTIHTHMYEALQRVQVLRSLEEGALALC